MRKHQWRILILFVLIGLSAAACGSGNVDIIAADPDGDPANDPLVLSTPISEQDIVQARIQLDAARDKWESLEPFAYTLFLGDQVRVAVEVDVDANGDVKAERALNSDVVVYIDELSVEAAFDAIDLAITDFETGTLVTPLPDACGNHFNASFDSELGSPTYFDRLGPCEDGIGLEIEVQPASE